MTRGIRSLENVNAMRNFFPVLDNIPHLAHETRDDSSVTPCEFPLNIRVKLKTAGFGCQCSGFGSSPPGLCCALYLTPETRNQENASEQQRQPTAV